MSGSDRRMRERRRRVDVVVCGLGGIGAAAAHHAAAQGLEVLGLEQFPALHDRGSSHGHSRIFRIAYFEAPEYVPLARRALEGWRALEASLGRGLLTTTGGLDIGRPDGRLLPGAIRSCATHDIPHERWDAATLAERVPGLALPPDVEAVYQPDAGILDPTEATGAMHEAARAAGADLRFGTRVVGWESEGEGVRVRVRESEASWDVVAGRLVIAPGAWLGELAAAAGVAGLPTIVPERQVVGWIPEAAGGVEHAFPVVNADLEEGHVYFMPAHAGRGVKAGLYHHRGEAIGNPDQRDRPPDDEDRRLLQSLVDRYVRIPGPIGEMRTCRFTLTPDEHFVVDTVLGGRVVLGGGCSGHGFKFAPALGECLVALARDRTPPVSIAPFALERFTPSAGVRG